MCIRIKSILYLNFLLTSITLQAQYRVYLYINPQDCSTSNAGSTEIAKIHECLKPTLLFSDLDSAEVEYGISEILKLKHLELPYVISSELVNKIKRHTKDITSRLVVMNQKENIVFDCDIKYIGQNIEKINQYVPDNFKHKTTLIPKSKIPVSFSGIVTAFSKNFLLIKNETQIKFYDTKNWQNTSTYSVKENFKPEQLYVKYFKDTVGLSEYIQKISPSNIGTLPIVTFSDNFSNIGDSLFTSVDLHYPSHKEIIYQGKKAEVWASAHFLVFFYKDKLMDIFPVYETLPTQDTISCNLSSLWIDKDTFYFEGGTDKKRYIVKCVLKNNGIYPVQLQESFYPKALEVLNEKENLFFYQYKVINNRYLYFNAYPRIYNVQNKRSLPLPFEETRVTYREGFNIKLSFYMVDFQYFRQKIYGLYRENDNLFYFSLTPNGKIDKKIPLPSEKRKSNVVLYKGVPYAVAQEGDFVRYE